MSLYRRFRASKAFTASSELGSALLATDTKPFRVFILAQEVMGGSTRDKTACCQHRAAESPLTEQAPSESTTRLKRSSPRVS